MNYSQVQLANIALGRVGARGQISSLTDGSANAIKINTVWDVIFQEVLSERDWKFAKTRTTLSLSSLTPLYAYDYAWAMPSDFLRFVKPHKRPLNTWDFYWGYGPEGSGWYLRSDPPVAPAGFPYVIENLSDGNSYLLTDYDGSYDNVSVMINYIQLISDYTKLTPGFVNAFCNRLAAEIAVPIKEDLKLQQTLMGEYKESLNSALAQNESMDFLQNETGSQSWISAGRGVF